MRDEGLFLCLQVIGGYENAGHGRKLRQAGIQQRKYFILKTAVAAEMRIAERLAHIVDGFGAGRQQQAFFGRESVLEFLLMASSAPRSWLRHPIYGVSTAKAKSVSFFIPALRFSRLSGQRQAGTGGRTKTAFAAVRRG